MPANDLTRPTRHGRTRTCIWLGVALVVSCAVSAVVYQRTRAYAIHQAEKDIQGLLLHHKALHLYMQRQTHPAFYRAKETGDIRADFYSPELLSSSYVVRNLQTYLNEVRAEAGLPALYYKLASTNPRNPVNAADELESQLIGTFNAHPEEQAYRDIVESDGQKYLYFAQPFLTTGEACLKCHGDPKDAPTQLQERYGLKAGFHTSLGGIRAIESIRVPIQGELAIAQAAFIAVTLVGVGITGLLLLNRHLRLRVRERTQILEREIAERKHAEDALRESEARVQANNQKLQQQVAEREKAEEELRRNMAQLERFNRLAIDRELRMVELKNEVNDLLCTLGQQKRYQPSRQAPDPMDAGVIGGADTACVDHSGAKS